MTALRRHKRYSALCAAYVFALQALVFAAGLVTQLKYSIGFEAELLQSICETKSDDYEHNSPICPVCLTQSSLSHSSQHIFDVQEFSAFEVLAWFVPFTTISLDVDVRIPETERILTLGARAPPTPQA